MDQISLTMKRIACLAAVLALGACLSAGAANPYLPL